MNILQLSPQFPYPADDGGRRGISAFTEEFSNLGHNATLFYMGDVQPPVVEIEKAKKFAQLHHCRHSTKNTLPRILFSAIAPVSLYMWKHQGSDVLKSMTQLLKKEKFDIIHVDHSSMAPLGAFAKKIANIPLVLRLHNVEYMIWKRYAENQSNILKKYYLSRQTRLLKEAETRSYANADLLLAITDQDKERALEMVPEANVVVHPFSIDTQLWKPNGEVQKNPYEMIIATTYNWRHNVDGLRWFIAEVLPKIRSEIPQAHLTLLGKNPPDEFRNIDGVKVVGYVPSVMEYLCRAGIYIAPLFVGGGIRIKILEAMALEMPVVATSVSAEGINADSTQGLFVENNPQITADIIARLMKDASLRKAAGESGRRQIVKYYDRKTLMGEIIAKYEEIIQK